MEPRRKITKPEAQLIRDAEFAHGEYLIALRMLASHLARGTGGRQIALAVTEAQSSGHWLQDCAWQLAQLDGEMRADRAWDFRED